MKKGFTLLELLAVIVILAVISLIVLPIIMNVIRESEKGSFKDSAYGIMKSAENYYVEENVKGNTYLGAMDIIALDFKGQKPDLGEVGKDKHGNIAIYMWRNKDNLCVYKNFTDRDVTLDESLGDSTACKNKVILGPIYATSVAITDEDQTVFTDINKQLSVTFEPSNATETNLKWESSDPTKATVSASGIVTTRARGTVTMTATTINNKTATINLNIIVPTRLQRLAGTTSKIKTIPACVDSGICAAGTAIAIKVNPTTTYNFNVVSDNGTKIVLMMDRNIKQTVPDSLTEEGNVAFATSNTNSGGPVTALAALKQRTSTWTNIPSFSYNLVGTTQSTNNGCFYDRNSTNFYCNENQYSISSSLTSGVKARLITLREMISLGCRNNNPCKSWLIQNTGNNGDITTSGYLTSTARLYETNHIWVLQSGFDYMYSGKTPSSVTHGIRPVIELSKT